MHSNRRKFLAGVVAGALAFAAQPADAQLSLLGAGRLVNLLAPITRNASRLYGTGFFAETPTVSAGSAVPASLTLVNESGAPITLFGLAFSGWYLTATGTSAVGNDYSLTGVTVEYPVGTTVATITSSGSGTIVVPGAAGNDILTDKVAPSTAIPAGATYKINATCTVASGSKFNPATKLFGLQGALTTVSSSAPGLVKCVPWFIGDSIMTVNNGAGYLAAAGLSSCLASSIVGTTVQSYTVTGAFDRQIALAQKIGITHFITNWSTNDAGGGRTAAQITADHNTIKAKCNAVGIKYIVTTMIVRTNRTTVAITSLTSSGTTALAVVPDATQFIVGQAYTITGATQTEYNATFFCTARNTSTNTITLLFPGSATPTATGSPIIGGWYWSSNELQTPQGTMFAGGSGSVRGTFNAGVRALSCCDGYIEWGDGSERSRDNGAWVVGGDVTALLAPIQTTVTSITIAKQRFNCSPSPPALVGQSGFVQWITGANTGVVSAINNNNSGTVGDVILTALTANTIAVGDICYFLSPTAFGPSDGTHPRLYSGAYGGERIIVDPTIAYLNTIR